jgi:hypothetical protein
MFEEYVERGEKVIGNANMFIRNREQVFQGLDKQRPQQTLGVPNRTETNCYKDPPSEKQGTVKSKQKPVAVGDRITDRTLAT